MSHRYFVRVVLLLYLHVSVGILLYLYLNGLCQNSIIFSRVINNSILSTLSIDKSTITFYSNIHPPLFTMIWHLSGISLISLCKFCRFWGEKAFNELLNEVFIRESFPYKIILQQSKKAIISWCNVRLIWLKKHKGPSLNCFPVLFWIYIILHCHGREQCFSFCCHAKLCVINSWVCLFYDCRILIDLQVV